MDPDTKTGRKNRTTSRGHWEIAGGLRASMIGFRARAGAGAYPDSYRRHLSLTRQRVEIVRRMADRQDAYHLAVMDNVGVKNKLMEFGGLNLISD